MDPRFAKLPSALERQARFVRLAGDIPALLAHPDWSTPAPTVVWLHGRTVHKELDPGRYLRWIRAGIAVCAIDLPGHGERYDKAMQEADATLKVIAAATAEIDSVVESLRDPQWEGVFAMDRLGLGGMSAGGKASLRRCCDPHVFKAIAVECAAGDFSAMPRFVVHGDATTQQADPMRHVDGWKPVPLLALHSEKDEWVPVESIRNFTQSLQSRYEQLGVSPALVKLHTWSETGALYEHMGFGKVAHEAKNIQTEFWTKTL